MLPLTRTPDWKPAPFRLGQRSAGSPPLDQGPRAVELPPRERLEQGFLNFGLGLGIGAVLGGAMNAFGARPSTLTAAITTGLGAILAWTGITWTGALLQAQIAQVVSGAVAGVGGMQLLKATSKGTL